MKSIKPVNGHVVLKELENGEQMVGNIYIPDLGKEKTLVAEVIDVSETFNYHQNAYKSTEVAAGDMVVIPRMGSQVISIDNDDFIVCKETDIIAIVK
jgi:chaperonin GroES